MTNVFDFSPKKRNTADSDFLKDASDTVIFDESGHGVSLSEPPCHFLSKKKKPSALDWSNQELANIYRVKRLLDTAGVRNHLERGLSDEGDPWCVFCTLAGDVFIHLCRFDGRYVLDSPNLRAPISGFDFAGLIEQFSNDALATAKAGAKTRRRVIRLERGGKVFLHPSVLLAALIWSIYLNSEDLVILAPEDEAQPDFGDDAVHLVNDIADAPLAPEMDGEAEFVQADARPDEVISTRMQDIALFRDEDERDFAGYKDLVGKTALSLAPGTVAIGLSSVAIAFGMLTEVVFEDEKIAASAGLDFEATLPLFGDERIVAEATDTEQAQMFDLAAILSAAFDFGSEAQTSEMALAANMAGELDVAALLAALRQGPLPLPETEAGMGSAFVSDGVEDLIRQQDPDPETAGAGNTVDLTPGEDPQAVALAEILDPLLEEAGATISFASLFDFKSSISAGFEEFILGGTKVEATFDLANVSDEASGMIEAALVNDNEVAVRAAPASLSLVTQTQTPTDAAPLLVTGDDGAYEFELFDKNVNAFIHHLMGRTASDEVEMVALDTEIIFIDFAAFNTPSAETYAMSWSMRDGGTVSTIGLKADFIEFDLIA